jgi:hypothetical protein
MGGFLGYPRNVADGVIPPEKLNKNKNRRYTFDPFDVRPHFSLSDGFSAPGGATGNVNLWRTNRGIYEWHVKGAGQTITAPVYDLTNGRGLDFAQDLTATEGHEVAFSPNITTLNPERGKHSYKIGTDKGFYARLRIFLTDASGVSPFFFGFRRNQAYQTALASYTDYAGFHLNVNGTVADIREQTQLNTGGVVTVDTTIDAVDGAFRDLEVRVTQQGRVVFILDGKIPTVTKTDFVFDTGDVVFPCSFFLHGADLSEALFYQEFEAGFLPTKGE